MEKFKWLISVVTGTLMAFAKKYALIVTFTAIAVVMDWITGCISAKVAGEGLNSQKAAKGFWKKVALFAALFFGFFLDLFIPYTLNYINIDFPAKSVFGMIFGCYIIVNECISIAENLYKCNPSILPTWVVKMLTQAKDKIDKEDIKE